MKLQDLDGVGPAREKKLSKAGISSLTQLAALEPDELVEKTGFSRSLAEQLITDARNASVASQQQIPTSKILLTILVVLAVLVGAYTLLSASLASVETYTYNGFTFTEDDCGENRTCWTTVVRLNVGNREVTFFYGPREVEDILVEPLAVESVLDLTRIPQDRSVEIVFSENATGTIGVAASNLARVTGDRVYQIPTSGSVYGQPVTCADANSQHVVIRFIENATLNGVSSRGDGCVIISGQNRDGVLKATDAYRLHLLQILRQ